MLRNTSDLFEVICEAHIFVVQYLIQILASASNYHAEPCNLPPTFELGGNLIVGATIRTLELECLLKAIYR